MAVLTIGASVNHLTVDDFVERLQVGNLQRADSFYGQREGLIGAAIRLGVSQPPPR